MGGAILALIVLAGLTIASTYMVRCNQRDMERRQKRSEEGMAALQATVDRLYPKDPMEMPGPIMLPKDRI